MSNQHTLSALAVWQIISEQEIFEFVYITLYDNTWHQKKTFKTKNLLEIGSNYYCYYLKKVGSARLRESGIHPISPKTPATQ